MSEQTSPTNLSENFNNSTEMTTTNELRSEEGSDILSVIRQDEQSSFSQNRGTFDSPAIQLPEEAEETTLRLQRIRDDLARQVREQENHRIELEIQQLQNSLHRRHRRESDHYADLTYDVPQAPSLPNNYDVPQAPSMSSTTNATTDSSLRSGEPILPAIPHIPIKEPRETIELVDFKKVITLHGRISCDMAERFYIQSRQAEFNLSWQQCIQDEALDYIRMRVKTSWMQLNVTESEAHEWNPALLAHKDMAILVYKLFGNTAKTETQVQIFNAIKEFNFGWRIDDKDVV
jgi:hypothetical protein